MQQLLVEDLGIVGYQSTWDYQEALLQENVLLKKEVYQRNASHSPLEINTKHHLLLLEHNHVYTLGKSAHLENLIFSEEECAAKGIEIFKINRGGDITYHGPGQLVGYPILDLEKLKPDIGWYLRQLEESIIKTLAYYNITGMRSSGETGVWVDADIVGKERKICAMGVRCSRWVTMHGFALNANTNLDYFNGIVPCGIVNKGVTSIAKELGHEIDLQELKQVFTHNFLEVFQVEKAS
jgi:lipoyl(octanoyl) transferase